MSAAPDRRAGPVALVALVLTAVGLSGVGDAPDPHAPAAAIAHWFVDRRDDVLLTAPFGYLGAIAVVLVAWLLATGLRDADQFVAARFVVAGGIVTAAYLFLTQILWTSIAYEVAETSPRDAKSLFVVTILAVPLLGVGLAMLLGGSALGALRGRTMPRWWCWITGLAAVVAAFAMIPLADSGFFSPDLQQQIAGNILLAWLLVSAATLVVLWVRAPRSTH
jgi:hypothetical protein